VSSCPDCGGEFTGVEYPYGHPDRYDGVSEYWCLQGCGARFGRWTGRRLLDGEHEPRFGGTLTLPPDPKQKRRERFAQKNRKGRHEH
jgi:hypothetical protein